MGKHTDIQWCHSTVNPTTGCDGCELWVGERPKGRHSCYAGTLHEARLAKSLPAMYGADFREVRTAPGRMAAAAKWSQPTEAERAEKPWLPKDRRVIFLGDMADVMSDEIPFDYLRDEVLATINSRDGRCSTWMLLTKRPVRLRKFASWLWDDSRATLPDNLWIGTSVTTQATVSRVSDLAMVPALHRFVSVEPMIESIRLGFAGDTASPTYLSTRIDLVICGGESGVSARPFDLEWARALQWECHRSGVSFFMKQLGADPVAMGRRVKLRDSHGGDWSEWPESYASIKVREFPGGES